MMKPQTLYEKVIPQITKKWLFKKKNNNIMYIYVKDMVVYATKGTWVDEGYVPYVNAPFNEKLIAFSGFYIENKQGKHFNYKKIKNFFDPFDKKTENSVRLDIDTILKCSKLKDQNIIKKLDLFLAKKLLCGRK